MKIFMIFISLCSFLFSNEFYSKIYPIHSYEVKSSVSGKIIKIYDQFEKKYVKSALVVKVDDYVDSVDLKESNKKLKNLQEILKIQKETYLSYQKVSSKSKIERDTQRIQVLNTATNISDLKVKIANLKNKIDNKNVRVKNQYLDTIAVEVGDYVNPGTLLYSTYDLSKGKLEVFLPIMDIEKYKNKIIYLDGKQTNLKIHSISKIADNVHISSYKAEIYINKPKNFSKLVKIEFK